MTSYKSTDGPKAIGRVRWIIIACGKMSVRVVSLFNDLLAAGDDSRCQFRMLQRSFPPVKLKRTEQATGLAAALACC